MRCVSSPSRIAPRHSRAALERVQRPAQPMRGIAVVRIAPPRAKLVAGLREKLGRFFEEDRQHLLVDIVAHRELGDRIIARGGSAASDGSTGGATAVGHAQPRRSAAVTASVAAAGTCRADGFGGTRGSSATTRPRRLRSELQCGPAGVRLVILVARRFALGVRLGIRGRGAPPSVSLAQRRRARC